MSLPLTVFWWYATGFRVNKTQGEVFVPGNALAGYQTYRIQYTGGFAEGLPEPIQQACVELVQLTYLQRNINPLLQSETLDRYSYTRAVPINWWELLSPTARMALQQYRIYRLGVEGVNSKA